MATLTSAPRPEYPRPQLVRRDWLCLNGRWQFEIDQGDSGLDRGLVQRPLRGSIIVPFCPESKLSGVENTDYLNAVWYRREVAIPAAWKGRRILLHFQASDYDTFVWANGIEVGRHRGGMTPFSCDLTEVAAPGRKITLVVRARDNARETMPSGKQAWTYANAGCHYTRTTGIWQTVWLEPVPKRAHLQRPKIIPDLANRRFAIEQPVQGAQAGLIYRARLCDAQGVVSETSTRCGEGFYPRLDLAVPVDRVRPWSPEDPHLYDLELELVDEQGRIVDAARSYAGLRSICLDGYAVKLNGRAVFQRLVLDQGYYPDGILTAPTDAALVKDIELSLAAGFNGARLHQKVFEERFLYHADRLGYLVWGEFSDWGLGGSEAVRGWWQQPDGTIVRGGNHNGPNYPVSQVTQWLEALQRDFNHPCIVGWCPLNESQRRLDERITVHDDTMRALFLATKLYDATRPVLDVSGYCHAVPESDIYDGHDYDQNPKTFRQRHDGLLADRPFVKDELHHQSIPWRPGQPYFVSEFGGILWNPKAKPGERGWGYGNGPKTLEEFYSRFEGLCAALLDNPRMFGYCYTQLTDVFQEQNGIFYFDRKRKYDLKRVREAQIRPAAIERQAGAGAR
ncbi:MAG: beta-galactosidase [Verrucomicrobia bacterium]|nr:beta-galactosidase [Verrucomicrobiota bacterium]